MPNAIFTHTEVAAQDSAAFASPNFAHLTKVVPLRPVPIAPEPEVKALVAILEAMGRSQTALQRECASLAGSLPSLNQSILAKAFRGELVPQDPNDEPASVLLERIREQRENTPTNGRRSPKTPGKPA